ncbi:LysM peptidoglycan-binding domain-containing protein [Vibrio tubiashii]|uniref:LysM peptidoglycan-binding domain-containing protein n=2 Tax=Vibrio tubiashii TaxID=29498 RepID=UPI001EFE9951|nr:LysM domain-containing protein [Vibrio tubiashii]MCG9580304.1 LysM peptidoglycan-binding domain-containing protein [Vibrio tubiashii]MCG9613895.1 LysM peptidoglycan-binding domain-containing protein [Vibrio tubiashii]
MTNLPYILKKTCKHSPAMSLLVCALAASHGLKAEELKSLDDMSWPLEFESKVYFGDTTTLGIDAVHSWENFRLKAGGQFHIAGETNQAPNGYHRNTFSVGVSHHFQLAQDLNLELGTGYAYRSAFVDYGLKYQLLGNITALAGYRFSFDNTEVNKNQFYTGLSIAFGHSKTWEESNISPLQVEVPIAAPQSEKHDLENKPDKPLIKRHQYTVKKGDWLIKIASKYNIPLSNLIENNNFENIDLIYPGDIIYYLK